MTNVEEGVCVLLPNGFKVLPFKFDGQSTAVQQMFYKPHQVREKQSNKPVGRTLLVVNVPPYCTKNCLKRIFEGIGSPTKVIVQKTADASGETMKPNAVFQPPRVTGYKVAYLIFETGDVMTKAFNANFQEPVILSPPRQRLYVGMKKWIKDREVKPDVEAVQAKINLFMKLYELKKRQVVDKKWHEEGVPDEEGWIKVTRFSRHRAGLQSEEKIQRRRAKTKKPPQKFTNFYPFQIKESKMRRIAELRMKHEEDKRRVELMKAARKFKPY